MATPDPIRLLEIDAALAHLRGVLDSGATSTTVAGRTVIYDLAGIRRRIGELENERAGGSAAGAQIIVPARFD